MAVVTLLPDLLDGQTKFLLDTNFLFFVFGNTESSERNINRQKKYLEFLEIAKKNKYDLFITSFALSEFVNRSLRRRFEQWQKNGNQGKKFKTDFRPSSECKLFLRTTIKTYLDEIISTCKKINDEFSSYENSNYFPYLSEIDFNDSLFAHVAMKCGFSLVTEDRDFNAPPFSKLSIVTANDTMYKSRTTV